MYAFVLRFIANPWVARAGFLLGGFVLGHALYPRVVSVPGPTVHERIEVNAPTQAVTSRESIEYRYIEVPSPVKGCPAVTVPSPVVSVDSSSTSTGGTATADVAIDQPAAHVSAAESRSTWRAGALIGANGDGLEVGGYVARRLLGPIEAGIYARVPTAVPGKASVGLMLGAAW